MEKDIENYLTNSINEMKTDNIFRLDYKEQSLKGNLKFYSWKNKMLQKLGNDAKNRVFTLYSLKSVSTNINYFLKQFFS